MTRRELTIVLRSPGFWIGIVAFGLLLTGGAMLPAAMFADPDPALGAAFLLGPATDIVLPLIAIIFGHAVIAGRRENGEFNQLLGFPYRRGELCLLLATARIVAVVGTILLTCLVAAGAIWWIYGSISITRAGAFIALTALTAGIYTTIAIGVSAMVRTRIRALGILLGGFAIAYGIWEPLLEGIRATDRIDRSWPDRLIQANPLHAYSSIADAILPAAPHVNVVFDDGDLIADAGSVVGGTDPTFTTVGIPLLVLLGWWCLPLLLGLYSVTSADLT